MTHPAPHGYISFTKDTNRLLIPVDDYNTLLSKCLVMDNKWDGKAQKYIPTIAPDNTPPPVHFVSSAEIAGILVAAKLDPT